MGAVDSRGRLLGGDGFPGRRRFLCGHRLGSVEGGPPFLPHPGGGRLRRVRGAPGGHHLPGLGGGERLGRPPVRDVPGGGRRMAGCSHFRGSQTGGHRMTVPVLAQIVEVPSNVNHLFDWPEVLPFGINRVVLLMFLATLATFLFLYLPFRQPRMVPSKMGVVVETLVGFVRNGIARDTIGPESTKYEWLLIPMFFWLLFLNLFEITPLIHFPVTSRMAIPAFLAGLVWIIFVFVGLKKHGFGYIKNSVMPPGVPKALLVLVIPIDFLSTFVIRPISLAVRLFANMIAGHIMLAVFFLTTASYFVLEPKLVAFVVPLAFAIVITAFEIFVAVLQAYIFTLLTAVYIESSINVGH
ncbi:MAG: F0F1 ATP synthase subunit A [Acidimicrobiia bacterium]|nr:F0F1 ATP synthase subunit A [Acidimicrobiia bacterium]MYA39808.1 F0F1 ATP synthase subunit A [Acidimicrobiia bacterium]MYK55926.1 F0F1 ATP synthase subunit A [Acidimicrobiia bacterium]